jgi:hypothetical protein
MKSYTTLKILDIDWNMVGHDLLKYKDDTNYLNAIVDSDNDFRKTWTDNLSEETQKYKNFGYTKHNTKIWKSTNKSDNLKFDWQQHLLSQLPLDNPIVTLTRQDPGQILPWHYDRHYMLKRMCSDDSRTIVRILVFMQDWKIGHILQIQDDVLTHWKKGQAVIWHPDTYHVAANIGIEKKWTCNITGFVNNSELENLLHSLRMPTTTVCV